MIEVMGIYYGNFFFIYNEGCIVWLVIEQAWWMIVEQLGVLIGEIFFIFGGLELNNMVLKCVVRDFGVICIISSLLEYYCVFYFIDVLQWEY